MDEFRASMIVSIGWAFATINRSDAPLFDALASVAEQRAGELKADDLANTAWAFGTAGR